MVSKSGRCLNSSAFSRASNQRGAVLVQTAIVTFLLTMLISGVLDYGLLIKEDSVVVSSARVGARTAAQVNAKNIPHETAEVLICGVAKLTARNFLSNAGLDPDDYVIQMETVRIPSDDTVICPPPPSIAPLECKTGIKVDVKARVPHWYFWRQSGLRLVGVSFFALESAEEEIDRDLDFSNC